MATVLIVEDELDIADLLDLYFKRDGWEVFRATDGVKAINAIRARQPDFVVLDIGLPGDMDGFGVCAELRKSSTVPILFLTARNDEVDRILGLEIGADDYVTKPFSPREVVARAKAILRRGSVSETSEPTTTAAFGEVYIDIEAMKVTKAGNTVDLATQELTLLSVFVENRGIVLSRNQLLDLAWGENWEGDERTVDVHVRQLRKKIGSELPLKTVRGHGYRLD